MLSSFAFSSPPTRRSLSGSAGSSPAPGGGAPGEPAPRAPEATTAVALLVALLTFTGCDDDAGRGAATSSSTTTTGPASEARRPSARTGGDFSRIPDVVRNAEPSVVAILTDSGKGSGVS